MEQVPLTVGFADFLRFQYQLIQQKSLLPPRRSDHHKRNQKRRSAIAKNHNLQTAQQISPGASCPGTHLRPNFS
jgi:hypothetical protein